MWGGIRAADDRAIRATARLVGMLGEHAVVVPVWRGGHLPADRYQWIPAAAVELVDPGEIRRRLTPPGPNEPGGGPWPGTLPAPSPIVMHDPPRPARLTDPAGDPVHVDGRGELTNLPCTLTIDVGSEAAVTRWAGPWPLDAHWWDPDPVRRRRIARLQVLTDDTTAFLLAAERQRWWVIGTYA